MKLERIPDTPEPSYPSFAAYRSDRREYLKTMAFGAGVLLLGGGWSCKKDAEVTGGVAAPPPAHPGGTPPAPGVPPPPQPVLKPPVDLEGDIAVPEPPSPPGGIKAPTLKPRCEIKGELPAPTPPAHIRGAIAVPHADTSEGTRAVLGQMPMPREPKKTE